MVLKRGPLRHVLRLLRLPGLQDDQADRRRAEKKPDVPLDEKCPQCGSQSGAQAGRFGEFTACSNYPTCKYVKQKTIGVKCPECGEGEIAERRSKRGKTFYGCNRYPDCDFVAWAKPMAEKCPECGPVPGGEGPKVRPLRRSAPTRGASTSGNWRKPRPWSAADAEVGQASWPVVKLSQMSFVID